MILIEALQSAYSMDGKYFNVDLLYADIFGHNSFRADIRINAHLWIDFVELIDDDLVSAEDLIFIAIKLAIESRSNRYGKLIKSIKEDKTHRDHIIINKYYNLIKEL